SSALWRPSEHLWSERNDAHKVGVAQLARDGPEDARAAGQILRVEYNGGVVVKADLGAIGPRELLGGPHDHRAHHLALLDRRARSGLFDRSHDDVADAAV